MAEPSDIKSKKIEKPKKMADPVAGIEQMKSLGVGRIMVPAFFFAGPGGLDRMSEFAELAIPAAAG